MCIMSVCCEEFKSLIQFPITNQIDDSYYNLCYIITLTAASITIEILSFYLLYFLKITCGVVVQIELEMVLLEMMQYNTTWTIMKV